VTTPSNIKLILPSLLLGLVASSAATAQVDQVSTRRQDGNTLIHDPSLTWSEGNYHVLHNGVEQSLFAGIGAGGASVPGVDGIGTWIPGEELRGNCKTSLGDFGYRQVGFRETVAVVAGGSGMIKFPYIAWIEFDGANGHAPIVFNNPTDYDCSVDSLGNITTGYGAPTSEASFIATTTGSGEDLLIPNEDVFSGPGTATVIAEIFDLEIPIPDPGYFWEVQIE
jgi:hypothetical protein